MSVTAGPLRLGCDGGGQLVGSDNGESHPFGYVQQDAESFGERQGFREPLTNGVRRRNHGKRIVGFSRQGLPSGGLDGGYLIRCGGCDSRADRVQIRPISAPSSPPVRREGLFLDLLCVLAMPSLTGSASVLPV